jgi:hypothetical protein
MVSMLINSYLCIFFIVPLVFILPLRSVDAFEKEDYTANNFFWALIIIGIALLVLLIFIDLSIMLYRSYIIRRRRKLLRA